MLQGGGGRLTQQAFLTFKVDLDILWVDDLGSNNLLVLVQLDIAILKGDPPTTLISTSGRPDSFPNPHAKKREPIVVTVIIIPRADPEPWHPFHEHPSSCS